MKKVIVLPLLLVACSVFAQKNKLKYGVRTSADYLSYSRVISDYELGPLSYNGGLSYTIEFVIESQIGNRVSISSGVGYSNKKLREIIDGDIYRAINPDDTSVPGDDIITHSNKFINIPLLLSRRFNNKVYANLGITNSFRVAYTKKQDFSIARLGNDPKIEYPSYVLGLNFGVGYTFYSSNTLEVSVMPYATFFVTGVHSDFWFEKNPIQLGVQFSVLKI